MDLPTISDVSRISEFVDYWAERTPDAEVAVLGETRINYSRLASSIDAVSRALMGRGVGKGDRVAALQTPHPDYLTLLLAVTSIGAIWVGLNPRYQLAEMVQLIEDCTPRLIVSRSVIGDRDYREDISALGLPTVLFDDEPSVAGAEDWQSFLTGGNSVSDQSLADARASVSARDPCIIVYTSGSTGAPKGAMLHHAGIVRFAIDQNRLWPVDPVRVVNYFPINHVGCVVDVSLPALAAGGTLIFLEKFDPAECLRLMEREGVTFWVTVPSVFTIQVNHDSFQSTDLSALQLLAFEGAPLPADLLPRLKAACPRLATNYGMTETTSAITALEPTDDEALLLGTVGSPFPGVEIRLEPEGGVGEVLVRSDLNFLGYWNRPEATAAAFTDDGFFRTGDLAERLSDGRFRFVGRSKEMFKSGGYNVYPAEIEAVLNSHPSIREAAVVSVTHPIWDEVGVAFVEAESPLASGELEAWCRRRLANYKIPKRYEILEAMPLLPIGKIDRPQLRQRASSMALT